MMWCVIRVFRWVYLLRDLVLCNREEQHVTTLENRPNAALLVVDVQNGVVSGNHERDAVVANIERSVEKAR